MAKFLILHPLAFTLMFLSVGMYNPGWRCLDNTAHLKNTTHINNTHMIIPNMSTDSDISPLIKTTTINTSKDYTVGSCEDFNQCQTVEFNPSTSTILTEWNLLCDKSWLASVVISVQMVGKTIGGSVGGLISDWFGRKRVLVLQMGILAVLELVCSFSPTLEVFMVMRFFLGVFSSSLQCISFVYTNEAMTKKWRAAMFSLPYFFTGAICFAIAAMVLKNWQHLEYYISCAYVVFLVPCMFLPESLRWLETKRKPKQFSFVAETIVRLNKKEEMLDDKNDQILFVLDNRHNQKETNSRVSICDLLRPGYKTITFIVFLSSFSYSLIYYAISFGVVAMYGDIYLNMIMMNLIQAFFNIFQVIGQRYMKRRLLAFLSLILSVVCNLGAMGCLLSDFDFAKVILSSILIATSLGGMNCAWDVVYNQVLEMYPTVIRSTALGFAIFSSGIGAIIAPFAIPASKETYYLFLIGVTVLLVIIAFVGRKLPETKGKTLDQTFDKMQTLSQNVENVDQPQRF